MTRQDPHTVLSYCKSPTKFTWLHYGGNAVEMLLNLMLTIVIGRKYKIAWSHSYNSWYRSKMTRKMCHPKRVPVQDLISWNDDMSSVHVTVKSVKQER